MGLKKENITTVIPIKSIEATQAQVAGKPSQVNIHREPRNTKWARPDSADQGYVDTLEDGVDAHPVTVGHLLVKGH